MLEVVALATLLPSGLVWKIQRPLLTAAQQRNHDKAKGQHPTKET